MDELMADADRLYTLGNVFLLDVQPFSSLQETMEMDDVNEARTQLCVIGFLLLNIFLGVIGTFWFRTQHRRSEIALRMSFGSTRRGVFRRLIAEGLLLLTLAAVPAVFIAFNVGMAELVDVERMSFGGGRFAMTVLVSWLLMALMIVLGIWYPARRRGVARRVSGQSAKYVLVVGGLSVCSWPGATKHLANCPCVIGNLSSVVGQLAVCSWATCRL